MTTFEVPPAVAGFVTETLYDVGLARSPSMRRTVSWVLLEVVGVRVAEKPFTVEVLRKSVPLIVRVTPVEPFATGFGEREVIAGTD